MIKLYICLKDEKVKELVEQVCKDIFVKDKSFNFTVFKNKNFMNREKDCMYILSINCKDKDDAHKKGVWFVNKVDITQLIVGGKLYYWVKEK